ncbi:hypothetical protein [Chitinophaga sp. OAE865]|uniref:hypothetical protein n=1 Tax=Chitinophaga sp. OAE865 TaxID=2817898 RepID=UPI001AE38D0B
MAHRRYYFRCHLPGTGRAMNKQQLMDCCYMLQLTVAYGSNTLLIGDKGYINSTIHPGTDGGWQPFTRNPAPSFCS